MYPPLSKGHVLRRGIPNSQHDIASPPIEPIFRKICFHLPTLESVLENCSLCFRRGEAVLSNKCPIPQKPQIDISISYIHIIHYTQIEREERKKKTKRSVRYHSTHTLTQHETPPHSTQERKSLSTGPNDSFLFPFSLHISTLQYRGRCSVYPTLQHKKTPLTNPSLLNCTKRVP